MSEVNERGNVIIVDATECPIRNPSLSWLQQVLYSGYKKMVTLKYEVAIDFISGLPVHYSGPVAGPSADIEVFRGKLKDVMRRKGWIGLADGSYQGEHDLLLVPLRPQHLLSPLEQLIIRFFLEKRVLIENLYFQVKSFKALSTRWRYHLLLHQLVFHVILNVITIDLKYHPLRQ